MAIADAIWSMFGNKDEGNKVPRVKATVLRRDEDDTVWVHIEGGVTETPVYSTTTDVTQGDVVTVRVEGGKAYIDGSTSSPSISEVRLVRAVEPIAADADAARASAYDAQTSADAAKSAADAAQSSADAAQTSANAAQSSATRANSAAHDALTQLSVVQDVAGTLDWIASHGTYTVTTDTSVQPGTVYFALVSGEYVPIVEPTGDPHAQGWYVLDVADSQTDYIMAHLAVTGAGLWVLPSGMGQAQTPAGAPGYKLLLASSGAYLYDSQGHLVTTYGESIILDSSRPQYIGGEDAYIVFYDSDDDGVPDSIRIGGANVIIGGSTLSEVMASVSALTYDHEYIIDASGENAIFYAHLYRAGADVKDEYDPTQFVWYRKTESDATPTLICTGYTCTVSLASMGYGGHVIGKFVAANDSPLLTEDDDALLDAEGEQLTVRTESGDSVRVSDLVVVTTIAGTDKLLVSGPEDEHLVSVSTLQGYLEANMSKQVLFGTDAQWAAQTSLVSDANTLYVWRDHATDAQGNEIAGIKVGDGSAYVVDLPFTDELLVEHMADSVRHVTAQERAFWNAKWSGFATGEQLVFITD